MACLHRHKQGRGRIPTLLKLLLTSSVSSRRFVHRREQILATASTVQHWQLSPMLSFSRQGKKHGHLMEQANAKAAEAIIKPQNADKTGVLDLHGLYVAEATEAARDFLEKQQKAKRFRKVEIITGAGHHSEGLHAKIRPAVERLVSGMDLPYHNPPHNDGAFVVEMYSNQDLVDQL